MCGFDQLNYLQGMLKQNEDILNCQIQEAMMALVIVASEATLKPRLEKILDTSAWSQPAAVAHLNHW